METIKRKCVNGSSVVEMAYIMPLFLGLFVILIHAVFYYHDKAVINGAAAETAVLGAQADRNAIADYDLEGFFYDRTKGKLIYMRSIEVSVELGEEAVTVTARVNRSIMRLSICQKAVIARPEKKIRQMERIT